MTLSNSNINYKDCGVDIEKDIFLSKYLDEFLSGYKHFIQNENVANFALLFNHKLFKNFFLASCCDGIGSKIIPLIKLQDFKTIAQDLIAMNLNDLICVGAKPLFFLDYIAANNLDTLFIKKLLIELKQQLLHFSCLLLGGETSQLNDLILSNSFDIAGFAVGLVEKDNLLNTKSVQKNDLVIGLQSSGLHSNGFSLIRKLFSKKLINHDEFLQTLTPTHIYVNEITQLIDKKIIKTCANITGLGIIHNINRALPKNKKAVLFKRNLPESELFQKLTHIVGEQQAFATFNMGLGFAIICQPDYKHQIFNICQKYSPFVLGYIQHGQNCDTCLI